MSVDETTDKARTITFGTAHDTIDHHPVLMIKSIVCYSIKLLTSQSMNLSAVEFMVSERGQAMGVMSSTQTTRK